MMTSLQKNFPAKLLLFGEYALLHGSEGLVLPLNYMSGSWDFPASIEAHKEVDTGLLQFYQFGFNNIHLKDLFDWNQFLTDISKGLFFSSTIPQGEGLGSSGSLCAAFCATYLKQEFETLFQTQRRMDLRNILSILEGHFHARSSGIDPYVSFLGKGLHLKGMHLFEEIEHPRDFVISLSLKIKLNIYLVPSFKKRSTKEWVDRFREKYQEAKMTYWVHEKFVPNVQKVVNDFLNQDSQFFIHLKEMAIDQFCFMPEFFAESITDLVNWSLKQESVAIKLCGAGGGGYYLLFYKGESTLEFEEIKKRYQLINVIEML